MNFDFSDEQQMLREQARRFLSETSTFHALRERIAQGALIDHELWRQVAELGWLAVAIPEEQGGLGLGALELCVLAEEFGRSLAPVPFHGTVFLGAELLKRCQVPEAAIWLSRIASGEAIIAAQPTLRWDSVSLHLDSGVVTGNCEPLAYAAQAHAAILPVLQAGQPALVLVDLEQQPLPSRGARSLDDVVPYAVLELDQTPVVVLAEGEAAQRAMRQVVDQDAILTAFEQIGGADAACQLARDYALERHTFGRPIGSYQAVKHKLADMAVKIELARSNAYFGAWAMYAGENADRSLAAAASRLSATTAFEYAARECIHLHGGIGYTWEADCHFFYKRSRLLAVILGQPGAWVDQLLADTSLNQLQIR
ncbi:acyl-CoA/acyl-ACP dehydrogenase [Pseudomonas sp. GD03860]|uniref:acyl-CoA dehydrogenase family protein n=1 Tax=Pseudomonas TaxID=286 RepID=UPI00236450D8|nr:MULTISPECIES: acyl-CoA dehydrogenase family protein [Pseudomonas]MDD2058425.1 acyl-CoA/acyl-ACP dehydrogenase [Pseudomonas putida]MDH0640237.1 acyl-CoA/acyl-ACP dehydrogenase [Pseudomonas sp. GD03860]